MFCFCASVGVEGGSGVEDKTGVPDISMVTSSASNVVMVGHG